MNLTEAIEAITSRNPYLGQQISTQHMMLLGVLSISDATRLGKLQDMLFQDAMQNPTPLSGHEMFLSPDFVFPKAVAQVYKEMSNGR